MVKEKEMEICLYVYKSNRYFCLHFLSGDCITSDRSEPLMTPYEELMTMFWWFGKSSCKEND